MSRSDAPDKDGGGWKAKKTIHIPACPLDAERLPPLLRGFGAVPPVVTDIDLSLDDRFLYVACWGTGELRQYDVNDPFAPRLAGTVELGGILHGADHPSGRPWADDPQMIEVSRDGRRVYGTNSLYGAWDPQFYPHGCRERCSRPTSTPTAMDWPSSPPRTRSATGSGPPIAVPSPRSSTGIAGKGGMPRRRPLAALVTPLSGSLARYGGPVPRRSGCGRARQGLSWR
jgi:56kDa selenium binding protein (SBP56)